jgi:hypothetical protein
MNWLQKVRLLKSEKERVGYSGPYFFDICPSVPSWRKGELEGFLDRYPYLPKSYIEYLKEFDSTSIVFCNFFGSQEATGLKIAEEIAQHKSLLKDNYFPFGCFPSGSILLFDQQGRVKLWSKDDYDFEQEPKVLAETFEEFVGECLLGKRYAEFDSINLDKNSFYKFLQSQNWA